MKTNFEVWIENNIREQNITNLLYEAVICYKASANKAALLLSYMAFIDIVRNRLIRANKPSEILDGEWNSKQNLLLNDDKAEQEVFDLLNRTDGKYFKINDSIRIQIKYWKDRRNDCAHLKNNPIEASHVESLWIFIMNNINKINVVGSGTDLLNRIKRHFDITYTPMQSDFRSLVKEIPFCVDLCDFNDFLVSLRTELQARYDDDPIRVMGEIEKFYLCMLSCLNRPVH